MSNLVLKDGDRYLFMGDSITDCGRLESQTHLGNGYAAIVPGLVAAQVPELQIDWQNRAISGETLVEINARWQQDCLDLKPTWLSMLIGINDLHRFVFGGDQACSPEGYAALYEKLLGSVRAATNCQFILLEPFYFSTPPGAEETQQKVFATIPKYIDVVHAMADKFGAKLIKSHEWGQDIIQKQDSHALCLEPVHPHLSGHGAIAQWVLNALQG